VAGLEKAAIVSTSNAVSALRRAVARRIAVSVGAVVGAARNAIFVSGAAWPTPDMAFVDNG